MTTTTEPDTTTWQAGNPEPPCSAVRGLRTQRIYFRTTHHDGIRWQHKQSGDFCSWSFLLRLEGTVQLVTLDGDQLADVPEVVLAEETRRVVVLELAKISAQLRANVERAEVLATVRRRIAQLRGANDG